MQTDKHANVKLSRSSEVFSSSLSWFAMTSSKIQANDFFDKIFTQYEYNTILKYFFKFQVDIPFSARVTAVKTKF